MCVHGMQKCNMTQLDKDDSFMQMQLQAGISDLTSLYEHQVNKIRLKSVQHILQYIPFQVANDRQSGQCIITSSSATQANLLCEEVVMPPAGMQHGQCC